MKLADVIRKLKFKGNNIKEKMQPKEFFDMAQYLEQFQWIPVSETKPEPEVEVEIAYRPVVSGIVGEIYTCRAMYEDGFVTSEDSIMCDDDWESWCEYDEERDVYFIPESWFEYCSFGEEYTRIPDHVLVLYWRPIISPEVIG